MASHPQDDSPRFATVGKPDPKLAILVNNMSIGQRYALVIDDESGSTQDVLGSDRKDGWKPQGQD